MSVKFPRKEYSIPSTKEAKEACLVGFMVGFVSAVMMFAIIALYFETL